MAAPARAGEDELWSEAVAAWRRVEAIGVGDGASAPSRQGGRQEGVTNWRVAWWERRNGGDGGEVGGWCGVGRGRGRRGGHGWIVDREGARAAG